MPLLHSVSRNAGAFAITLFLLFSGFCALAHSQPSMTVSTGAEIDFGTLRPLEAVEKDIVIRNSGSAALIIGDIASSCECAEHTLKKNIIPPNDSAILHLRFSPRNVFGAIERSLSVVTNDPLQHTYLIKLLATIRPPPPKRSMREIMQQLMPHPITVIPPDVQVKKVTVGTSKKVTVTLRNRSGQSVKLLFAPVSEPDYSVEISGDSIRAKGKAKVSIVLHPGNAKGYFHTIRIGTDYPSQPMIEIPVKYTGVKKK